MELSEANLVTLSQYLHKTLNPGSDVRRPGNRIASTNVVEYYNTNIHYRKKFFTFEAICTLNVVIH